MEQKIKVGLIKETKTPPDRRVALTPQHGVDLLKQHPTVNLFIQPSQLRCYKDDEYSSMGLNLKEDLSDCDILIGIKEVHIPALIEGKTYIFFSHTAKKQPHNRKLLQEIIKKKVTLIDYEYLTDTNAMRLVAFGHWAGVVGAYNAILGWGIRNKSYNLRSAHRCHDQIEMNTELKKVQLDPIKIMMTGGGRVAHGAMQTLSQLNLRVVTTEEFLNQIFDEPVVCQVEPWDYVKHKEDKPFDLNHFFQNPGEYESTFLQYTKVADIYIPCHFWDSRSPIFISSEDLKRPDFNIKLIADISCDIKYPIASTIRSSTIESPFYGYNKQMETESDPWDLSNLTVMAVDNLPGELPRDSSKFFGEKLLENVIPALVGNDQTGILERATITNNGSLTKRFSYLENFVRGIE